MKKLPTKDDIRRELNQQIAEYLTSGQVIAEIPKGVSGRDPMQALPTPIISENSRQTRTPLTEVSKEIELRKRSNKPATAALTEHNRRKRNRDTIKYDDFGEPLRVIRRQD